MIYCNKYCFKVEVWLHTCIRWNFDVKGYCNFSPHFLVHWEAVPNFYNSYALGQHQLAIVFFSILFISFILFSLIVLLFFIWGWLVLSVWWRLGIFKLLLTALDSTYCVLKGSFTSIWTRLWNVQLRQSTCNTIGSSLTLISNGRLRNGAKP